MRACVRVTAQDCTARPSAIIRTRCLSLTLVAIEASNHCSSPHYNCFCAPAACISTGVFVCLYTTRARARSALTDRGQAPHTISHGPYRRLIILPPRHREESKGAKKKVERAAGPAGYSLVWLLQGGVRWANVRGESPVRIHALPSLSSS